MTAYDGQPAASGRFRTWLAMVWHRIRTFFRSSDRLDLPLAAPEPMLDERERTIEFYRSLLEEPIRGVSWWYSQNEGRTTDLPQIAEVFVQVRAVLSAPPGGLGEDADRFARAGWDELYATFTDREKVDGANGWATLMASMFEQKGHFDLALQARQLGRSDAEGTAHLNGHPAPVPDQASPLE